MQTNLFTGKQLADIGMNQALDNADRKVENWSEIAYQFLLEYIKFHSEFMIEDVRIASIGIVPDPPSGRAWGGIVVRAKNQKLIINVGLRRKVKPDAHMTPAALWRVQNG